MKGVQSIDRRSLREIIGARLLAGIAIALASSPVWADWVVQTKVDPIDDTERKTVTVTSAAGDVLELFRRDYEPGPDFPGGVFNYGGVWLRFLPAKPDIGPRSFEFTLRVDKNKPVDFGAWLIVYDMDISAARANRSRRKIELFLANETPHKATETIEVSAEPMLSPLAQLVTGRKVVIRYKTDTTELRDLEFLLGGNTSELMSALKARWMTPAEESAFAEKQKRLAEKKPD